MPAAGMSWLGDSHRKNKIPGMNKINSPADYLFAGLFSSKRKARLSKSYGGRVAPTLPTMNQIMEDLKTLGDNTCNKLKSKVRLFW